MTGMRHTAWRPEFHRPLDVGGLEDGEEGRRHLEADADERAALSKRFGLLALDSLEADVAYVRHGRSIDVHGRVTAELTQSCVVTLEPLASRIDEPFSVTFDPNLVPESEDVVELTPDELADEEDVQPLIGDVIDLGETVAECLGLAIEPYPRKAGSEIDPRYAQAPGAADPESGPFAVLKKLKS
jgi:uncharacterized metal-binding protein YceD (DUF177 family)